MKQITKWKKWHKVTVGIIFGFLALMIIAATFGEDPSSKPTEKVISKQDSATLHKEKIEKMFDEWDGTVPKLVEYTKDNLNDPESFEHLKTVYWDRDSFITVKMEYTAKNGFGGRVRGTIMANCDLDGNIQKIIASK